MSRRNKAAMVIAIAAGTLLFVAGVNGAASWEVIRSIVSTYITDNAEIQTVFAVLIFVASLGGISVAIGGLAIGKNFVFFGKILISLGAGMGLIGLIVNIILAAVQNSFVASTYLSAGGIGLILSILARYIIKK